MFNRLGVPVTTYDPSIIQEFADRLYRRAGSIVFTWTLGLGLIGAVIGGAVGSALRSEGLLLWAGVGAFVLGIIGYQMGSERAFALRLQAQTALCQAQIEANTRPTTAESQQGPTFSI